MASTLRSPTAFLSGIDSGKTHKAIDADLPPISVTFGSTQASRRVRAKVISAEAVAPAEPRTAERLYRRGGPGSGAGRPVCNGRVPVYVMLPLDTVGMCGGLTRARALGASMMALRSAGVEGVMVDVWWGVVERVGPGRYDWEAYLELVRMAEKHGLKLQMVMSFHQCGGNVGDSCKYVIKSASSLSFSPPSRSTSVSLSSSLLRFMFLPKLFTKIERINRFFFTAQSVTCR